MSKEKYSVGKIRFNKFGQEYIIIEKIKGGRLIRFIETGTERKVGYKEISNGNILDKNSTCLLYTSPSPRD